jgi:hypothetical protein
VNRFLPRQFVASLSYYVATSESFPSLYCGGCRSSLDLHQPDPNRSEHFLGACSNCGRWYRVMFGSKDTELIVLELPEVDQIEANVPPSKDEMP